MQLSPLGRRTARDLYYSLPTKLRVRIDFAFRKERLLNSFEGPLNGQTIRRSIVDSIINKYDLDFIFESGTFRGASTAYFAKLFSGPIYTVEISEEYYLFAKLALSTYPNVKQINAHSVHALHRVAGEQCTNKLAFFYLDAHWLEDLPLQSEVRLIDDAWTRSIILVDDCQVPTDPGYGFDDYGEGKQICLEHLLPVLGSQMAVFFPSTPANQEAGRRRGYALIVKGASIIDEFRTEFSELLYEVRDL